MKRRAHWEEALQRRLQDAELPVAADNWARIEQKLYPMQAKAGWWARHKMPLRIAAAILIGLFAVGLMQVDRKSTSPRQHDAVPFDPPTPTEELYAAQQPSSPSAESPAPVQQRVSNKQPSGADQLTQHIVPTRPVSVDPHVADVADEPSSPTTPEEPAPSPTPEMPRREPTPPQPTTPNHSLRSGDYRAQAVPRSTSRDRSRVSFALFGGSGSSGGKQPAIYEKYMFGSAAIAHNRFDASNFSTHSNEEQLHHLFTDAVYRKAGFKHRQPWSIGLTMRKELAHALSVESGLVYTLLRSEVYHQQTTGSQELHMVGIPLRLNWNFVQQEAFSFYIGAGGVIERCLYAEVEHLRLKENRTYFSIGGAVGAEYRFSPTVALFAEPELSYALTRTRLRSIRNDEPLTLTLRLGIRFTLP